MEQAKATPGPWFTGGTESGHVELLAAGPKRIGVLSKVGLSYGERRANADLVSAAPELLVELQKAHQIIRNALAVMTTTQKLEWGQRNAADGVDGDGITRAHEREAVIARATGAQS